MINGSIHYIDIKILNMYEQSLKNMKQNLREPKGNRITTAIRDFNTNNSSFSNWKIKQEKRGKDIGLNTTTKQLDLTNNHWTLHPITTEYTFFSSAYERFTKIDHILGHNTNLSKVKRMASI